MLIYCRIHLHGSRSIDLLTSNPPPVEEDITITLSNPLDVPYEYQLDNASGTGYREMLFQ